MVNYRNDASDRNINLSAASDCTAVFSTLPCLLLEQQEHGHTFDSVPHRVYVGHSLMCTALDSWFHTVLDKAALLSLLLWFSNIRSAECYHLALLILKKIFSYYWEILIHPLLVICPILKSGVWEALERHVHSWNTVLCIIGETWDNWKFPAIAFTQMRSDEILSWGFI